MRDRVKVRFDEDSEAAHCINTGSTATTAMMTEATGRDEERRITDVHHVTSILSAFSWRQLEPIQSVMAVEQSETAADRAAVLSERHEPQIWLRLAIVDIQVARQTVGGSDVINDIHYEQNQPKDRPLRQIADHVGRTGS
jgi:hypothetical protein